jgi:hypothetical protein
MPVFLEMLALVLFSTFMQARPANLDSDQKPDVANVIESTYAAKDWDPAANPDSPEWSGITGIEARKGFFGEDARLPPTQVRSRWTRKNLYLLFICPYLKLNLKPNPVKDAETNQLWNWDVAEAFIGSDYLRTSRYKEFQVSPHAEYVDLDIDRDNPREQKGVEWQSGFTVAAQIDQGKKVWRAEMKIPFESLDIRSPKPGNELRIGLFRIEGAEPDRIYVTWRPTGATTFHVPSAFGSLVLKN